MGCTAPETRRPTPGRGTGPDRTRPYRGNRQGPVGTIPVGHPRLPNANYRHNWRVDMMLGGVDDNGGTQIMFQSENNPLD